MTHNHENTHEGKVVSLAGDKLTTSHEGKEHHHTITKDAKVTHDGKPGKTEDLKPGTDVRLTTKTGDKTTAVAVDSGKHITGPAVKA